MTEPKKICVVGDVTRDINIYHKRGFNPGMKTWNWDPIEDVKESYGGAAFLRELLNEVSPNIAENLTTDTQSMSTSYSLWVPYPSKSSKKKDTKQVWRMKEFFGQWEHKQNSYSAQGSKPNSNHSTMINPKRLLVIDDGSITFRNSGFTLPDKFSKQILFKTVSPFKENRLFSILEKHATRTIIIVPADHLRRANVQISRSLCWEDTVRDIVNLLTKNRVSSFFAKCKAVVVTFETAGALIYSNKCIKLIIDPEHIEGTWVIQYPGKVISYASCFTVAIATLLTSSSGNNFHNNLECGVRVGIAAARKLHEIGHGEVRQAVDNKHPQFPMSEVADHMKLCMKDYNARTLEERKKVSFLADMEINNPMGNKWSIKSQIYNKKKEMIIARNIVKFGVKAAIPRLPLGQFGKIIALDPQEISQFRALRKLFIEYIDQDDRESPLSIAVFGPPGSGKSFAVKEIAASADPDGKIEHLPAFNLSQLNKPEEMFQALHLVRDSALKGKIPLVFWDEFDTSLGGKNELGWLRYFLAPMQDGQFQQGETTHSIGRAIFVFAGGTKDNYLKFSKNKKTQNAKDSKVPDFLSRLRGKIDIFGVGNGPNSPNGFYLLRRAILLRALLEKKAADLFDELLLDDKEWNADWMGKWELNKIVDRDMICHRLGDFEGPTLKTINIEVGIVDAFLSAPKFEYGARSMEAIIEMSQLAGRRGFERSSLPSKEQLSLHVDADAFIDALNS
ncbi:MAG: ATP-binding protein [Nitrospirae bacterium]|nr:ATP-binding protein [Nitrospirota bacterium]